jgi:hypothetical protein
MNHAKHPLTTALALSALALLFFAVPAYAYIDPGTGSMIWQVLLAGALGLFFVVRTYGRRILNALRRKPTAESEDDEADE